MGLKSRVLWLKCGGFISPLCCSNPLKSMLLPLTRGQVPVLSRPTSKPKLRRLCDNFTALPSPNRPFCEIDSPICTIPFKKVPVVRITFLAQYSFPRFVRIPTTRLFSHKISSALSCEMVRFGESKSIFRAVIR